MTTKNRLITDINDPLIAGYIKYKGSDLNKII